MNGQMKSFNIDEVMEKDKLARDFIESVNPYRYKPSLGIDLLLLSKYIKKTNKPVNLMSEEELDRFKIKQKELDR